MWTIRCSHLLLHLLLSFTCTRAESELILKGVTLNIKPANTVERGSELTLTCVANIIHSGSISPLHFSFFKDFNKHNTVYILQTTSDQVKYTISDARASHTGTYQCDVMVNNQYKESSTEKITVKGVQTPRLSVDKFDVNEGDIVRIICSAKEESGLLHFIIKDDLNEIYQEETTSGEVQKNHSLRSVGMAKISCSYLIKVGSTTISSNDSNVVSVVVKDLDIMPTITVLPSTQVIEGDPVHITCGVKGTSHNSTSLMLSKGSYILQRGKTPEFIAAVLANNSGTYECSVLLKNVDKTVKANLTVKELFSTPVLTITPTEVFERQQFNVTCTSSEFASERIGRHDVKYSIYRNNQRLNSSDGAYRTTAHTKTNGNYTCTAQVNDTIKWSNSKFFKAKVLVSKPTITVLGEVVLGRSFQIECYSDTGSFPITYSLNRNHRTLNYIEVSTAFQKAIFNASIMSENEIHEFRCEAQNNGINPALTSNALLAPVTVPVGKPTLMTIPKGDAIIENEYVEFLCFVTEGTPPISFKWYQGEDRRPVHTITVMKNHSTYNVPVVKSVHSGRYYCEAINGAGIEEASKDIMVTVRIARWKQGLISGVCLLCVTGLVIAFVIRYRANRVKVASSNGAGIWTVRPPVLDISEVVDVDEPEEPNVEYTEVLHPQTTDPARVPLRQGTDTVYSEVQRPTSGSSEEY
ncbi:platelet endothelial cell adhesion molecule isoform X2 [Ictalurus furcatus]|uniref:platelet endothelial cell adhesion molecule isoform X2 n=1 Tax=Ictalurus furcatus TaxID=66913 RepID=UPI002350CD90|nr:platelet endothelial cell adhesion molecule isoform X2 [Ictalurus furcatus]